ncbi:uncharacterized protein [Triticum aestivum]|uniref:uncharacterized protein n=1 Tax=Triticum aestivum TaxID=4565 RepID=UPI001D0273EF|nr:uncharacterized protein LOC123076277 [Triticum aestivum]
MAAARSCVPSPLAPVLFKCHRRRVVSWHLDNCRLQIKARGRLERLQTGDENHSSVLLFVYWKYVPSIQAGGRVQVLEGRGVLPLAYTKFRDVARSEPTPRANDGHRSSTLFPFVTQLTSPPRCSTTGPSEELAAGHPLLRPWMLSCGGRPSHSNAPPSLCTGPSGSRPSGALTPVQVELWVAATNFTKRCTSVQVEHTHRENTSAFALHIAWSCMIADGCSKRFISLIFCILSQFSWMLAGK